MPRMKMATKRSGGVATKKKPSSGMKSAARPKLLASSAKAKPAGKKALTITVTKKPVPPPVSRPAPSRHQYSVHPGVSMMRKWTAAHKKKPGGTREEWISSVGASGPADITARRIWLKEKHGLGTNSAWWIAERSEPGASSLVDDDPQAYL